MPIDHSFVRVKAMAIIPNDDFTAHLVTRNPPTAENPSGYHRLIGGGIELGETSREAVEREVREELGTTLLEPRLLGVVESIYRIDGEPGHEVVFLYAGRVVALSQDVAIEGDSTLPLVWRSMFEQDEMLPLYPADAVSFVHRLPRPEIDRAGERSTTIASYDADAASYGAGVARMSDDLRRDVERFVAAVGRDGRVLEIGSGSGRDADALEALGLRVDRTDITPAFVRHLRETGHEARVLDPLCDGLEGPYDAAWCNAVLLHLSRVEMPIVLFKLHEAVLPDGYLYVSVKEGAGEGWTRHGNVRGARHFTYWNEDDLRAAMTAAGWTVVDLRRSPGSKLAETWLSVLARRG